LTAPVAVNSAQTVPYIHVGRSAAELLADVDPQAAAPACLAIACDRTVGDEVRRSAAERLAALATL